MTDLLKIDYVEGEDVVDSRLIAKELGIQHESFMANLKKHQDKLERKFGVIRFNIVKPSQGSLGGRPESFAWLNENQATTLMTLSKNTDRVVDLKITLVDSFSKAKKIIREVIPQQNEEIEKLKLQLEIAKVNNESMKLGNSNLRLQKSLIETAESVITIHGLPVYSLIIGRPDAVVEVETKITETVVCKNGRNVNFEGSSTAEVGRKYGFKSGTQFTEWLKSVNAEHLICQGLRAVQAPYIPKENLEEIKHLWMQNKNRQILLGE